MKIKILLVLSLFSLSFYAHSFEVEFIGPCSDEPLLSSEVDFIAGMKVGNVSLKVLEENGVPFKGTNVGINQVFDTAIGLDAMEVISDTEMMAYGWCFEVDGIIPEVFADKVAIDANTRVVSWFYGYAHFLNGKWVSQCEKSYLRRPTQYCR